MKYKAVIFDMDGTVLDTLQDLTNAVNYSLAQFKLPPVSDRQVRAGLGNGAGHLISRCVPAGCDEKTLNDVLAFYKPYYDEHCCIDTAPYPGVLPLMAKLKAAGIKLAILSNKPHTAVQPLAEKFFGGLLEFAQGESETVHRKPDPSGLFSAVKQLGLEVCDCVYVGDSEVDVQTGVNAAMDCIAVSWGFRDRDQLEATGVEMLADNCEELENYIL